METPRNYVGFKGTIRYASVACYKNCGLSYKDDVESWLYMLTEIIVANGSHRFLYFQILKVMFLYNNFQNIGMQ